MQGFVFALVFLFTSQNVLGAPQNVNPFEFPEDGCFFENKMCDTNANGKVVEGGDNPTNCRQKCIDETDAGGKCKTWVFYEFIQGKPECHLLEDACIEVTDNHCTPSSADASQCASGENPCPTVAVCDKLTSFDPDNKAHWHCTSGKSPYVEAVAPGDTCFVDCSTWTNSAGEGEPTEVSSFCQDDGNWSPANPTTVMDSADTPAAVSTPANSPNPTCGCTKISIKGGTLKAGTELYEKSSADGGYEKKDLANTVDIKTGSSYIMFCDNHLALEINCSNGLWSEGIKDCTDIYCWDKPDSAAECTPEYE